MCGVLMAGAVLLVLVPLRRPERLVVAAQVLVTALTWLVMNRSFEGQILAEPFPGNGLTLADLLALPSALLAGALAWSARTAPAPRRSSATHLRRT